MPSVNTQAWEKLSTRQILAPYQWHGMDARCFIFKAFTCGCRWSQDLTWSHVDSLRPCSVQGIISVLQELNIYLDSQNTVAKHTTKKEIAMLIHSTECDKCLQACQFTREITQCWNCILLASVYLRCQDRDATFQRERWDHEAGLASGACGKLGFCLTDHPSPGLRLREVGGIRTVRENCCGAGSSTLPHFQEGVMLLLLPEVKRERLWGKWVTAGSGEGGGQGGLVSGEVLRKGKAGLLEGFSCHMALPFLPKGVLPPAWVSRHFLTKGCKVINCWIPQRPGEVLKYHYPKVQLNKQRRLAALT